MPHLSAALAASFSRDIYTLVDSSSTHKGIKLFTDKYTGIISKEIHNAVLAKTGGPAFIKSRAAFGLFFDRYSGL